MEIEIRDLHYIRDVKREKREAIKVNAGSTTASTFNSTQSIHLSPNAKIEKPPLLLRSQKMETMPGMTDLGKSKQETDTETDFYLSNQSRPFKGKN